MKHGFSAVTPELAVSLTALTLGLIALIWNGVWLAAGVLRPRRRWSRLRKAIMGPKHAGVVLAATTVGSAAMVLVREQMSTGGASWAASVVSVPTLGIMIANAVHRRKGVSGDEPTAADFVFGCAMIAGSVIWLCCLAGYAPPGFEPSALHEPPHHVLLQVVAAGLLYGGVPASIVRAVLASWWTSPASGQPRAHAE